MKTKIDFITIEKKIVELEQNPECWEILLP